MGLAESDYIIGFYRLVFLFLSALFRVLSMVTFVKLEHLTVRSEPLVALVETKKSVSCFSVETTIAKKKNSTFFSHFRT
jgi:hypothetical protein